MAEGWNDRQKVLCRYFMHGVCKEGEKCQFSHDRLLKPSMICKFYLKGSCSYGSECRYDHIKQERLDSAKQNAASRISTSTSKENSLASSSKNNSPLNIQSNLSATAMEFSQEKEVKEPTHLSTLVKSSVISNSKLCADAPEFIPMSQAKKSEVVSDISFAQIVGDSGASSTYTQAPQQTTMTAEEKSIRDAYSELCPYFMVTGKCQRGQCNYIHGNLCDMCQLACLHPENEKQRNNHNLECTKLMEAEMEHSFAFARSKEKLCGVCMDVVMEKPQLSQRRFGILPNCSHCFCIECLRKWRQSKQFENKIVRACPECRVKSDYVIPSRYWVDDKDKEEKDKLLQSYSNALSVRPCKYFNKGEGDCPFGNKCFYLHALPDGTKKDVGPPKRRTRVDSNGELHVILESFHNMFLWDFLEQREQRIEFLTGSIQSLLLEFELDQGDDLAPGYVSDSSDYQ